MNTKIVKKNKFRPLNGNEVHNSFDSGILKKNYLNFEQIHGLNKRKKKK